MKLRTILESILNELGDRSISESEFRFRISSSKRQQFTFSIDNLPYIASVYIYNSNQSGFRLTEPEDVRLKIQFEIEDSESFELTNENKALQVMSYIVSGLEFLIKKYNQEMRHVESPIQISQIIYEPTSESDEPSLDNKRNKLYQYYIQKMGKKYNSNVKNSNFGTDSVQIDFSPSILIK